MHDGFGYGMMDGFGYGMMGGMDGLLYQFGTGLAGAIAVISIAFGVMQCYFGYKVFKILMAITGFFVGGGIGGVIGGIIISETGGGGGIVVLLAIIGGIVGVLVAVKVYFLGIFLYGFAIGFIIIAIIDGNMAMSAVIGIIFGVLLVIFDRLLIIILSALSGGTLLGTGTAALLFSLGISVNSAVSTLLTLAFIATGLYYQFKVNGGLPAMKRTAKKNKNSPTMEGSKEASGAGLKKTIATKGAVTAQAMFCENCGSPMEPGSIFCSNCGKQA